MMTGIIVSIIVLALTVLGLVVRITTFSTKLQVWVEELRREMREDRSSLTRIPLLELKVAYIEKHLELSTPELSHNAE